jgi:hypothetical protein
MKRCIEARLYYPALLVALTIPEICMALTMSKAEFVKKAHYVHFVDKYTTPAQLGLSGIDCFMLRGGLIHRADLRGHAHFAASHVIFSTPESKLKMHALSMKVREKVAVVFDLELFCRAMDAAARQWFQENKTNALIEENAKNLIRLCPKGLSPFVVGQPILASGE